MREISTSRVLFRQAIAPAVLCGMVGVAPASGQETDFSAGAVMENMEASERFPFIAGIIEGLAHARYIRDGNQTDGMTCIYDWFYETENAVDTIYVAFGAYPDYPPAAIVAGVLTQKCGE